MSRCFPFPPPGYEKKVRTDDIDLLAKEKHKEKRHRKDKKDKEKRDGKEKEDKDRSKERHGERKDRKEKHKDKKKRDADNGNAHASEEKRIEGRPESSNGQKHGSNGLSNGDIKDHKYVQELERRIRNNDRATGSQVVQKITVTDQRPLLSNQSKGKERIKGTKDDDRLVNGHRATGGLVVQKITVTDQRPLLSNQSREKERIKATKEDDKTVNAQRATGSQVVQKTMVTDQRSMPSNHSKEKERINGKKEDDRTVNGQRATGSQAVPKFMVTDQRPVLSNPSREKERNKDKKDDDRTLNAQTNHVVGKFSAGEFVQTVPSIDRKRLEGIAKPIEKAVEKQIEGRDRKRNGEYDSRVHKPKERDKEKKDKSKDKNKENKKEKKEKGKQINKLSDEQLKLEGNGTTSLDAFSNKAADILQMNGKNSSTGGNLGKRKDLEMNGYLHENGFLPHKLPKSVSSHSVVENGRKSEPSQTALQFLPKGKEAASNCKADTKESKINGFIGSEQHSTVSTRPSSSTVKVSENGEPSAKRPHPDSKYLTEILSIPKMEDVSDFDDQEWLFSSNGLESKKLKVGSPETERTPQVWAEAMKIESVDLFALPYVIPY